MLEESIFVDRHTASLEAAKRITKALSRNLTTTSEVSIVVSGGSTPAECLRILSQSALDWARVHVVPSDERWVEVNEPDSNEGMLRRTLLQGPAASAQILPLYEHGLTPKQRCLALNSDLEKLPLPFTTVLLGMGEDGHFASLFPDAPQLQEGLDPKSHHRCLHVQTAASPHPRVTLTLSQLLHSMEFILLIFGAAKKSVYEQAKQDTSSSFPISRVLNQNQVPVQVLWAP